MTENKEQLTERAQLVRLFEASAKIEFPSKDELNFRLAIMKKVGLAFGLREVRPMAITGTVTQAPQRPQTPPAPRAK